MKIKSLHTIEERILCLNLAWNVFLKFEANEYGEEGTQNFRRFIESDEAKQYLVIYGAYKQDILVGMMAIRLPNHIALFFVKEEYHHQGVGKALFQEFCKRMPSDEITVNSSPYAVTIYEKLGFHKISEELVKDGIHFTPMKYQKGL